MSTLFLFAIAIANIFILVGRLRGVRARQARRTVRRGRSQHPAREPRPLGPAVPAAVPLHPRKLADVSAGLPVRARLRHRDRDRRAGDFRVAGRARPVVLVAADLPGAVHRRHEPRRHDRFGADGARLWLGVRETDPQALLQSDDHVGVGRGGAPDRRRRGAGTDRREARAHRRRSGIGSRC